MVIEIKETKMYGRGWTMRFDLDYICENIGKKEKDKYDGTMYTIITRPHARKIFKLISQYHEDPDEVRHYIKKHYPNVLEIWDKAVSRK